MKSKKTQLLIKRTIRCNGKMHEIGLNSKGQLYIPNHTVKELERFLMMEDLGNNPCKCAVIYDAWRKGEFGHKQIHNLMQREKITAHKMANRLLRALNLRRNWPDIDIVFAQKREVKTEKDPGYNKYNADNKQAVFLDFIKDTVKNTLIARGYDASKFDNYYGSLGWKHEEHYTTKLLSIYQNKSNFSVIIGGKSISGCSFPLDAKDEDVPWRVIIDGCEVVLIESLIKSAQAERYEQGKEEVKKVAKKLLADFGPLPKYTKIELRPESGTAVLSISLPGLTIPAAIRIAKHYGQSNERIKQFIKINHQRKASELHYPDAPDIGLGEMKKKKKASIVISAAPSDDDE